MYLRGTGCEKERERVFDEDRIGDNQETISPTVVDLLRKTQTTFPVTWWCNDGLLKMRDDVMLERFL